MGRIGVEPSIGSPTDRPSALPAPATLLRPEPPRSKAGLKIVQRATAYRGFARD